MLQAFSAFVHTALQDWQVPGAAVVIVKDRHVVLAEGFGFRDATQHLPVTPNTIFGIASCTKAFTALAMGMLVDDGLLDWDRPVRGVFPAFTLHDPVASERITPRDLLVHRSGLPRHDLVWYNADLSLDALIARLPSLEPSAEFRTTFQYNNLLYMIAGHLAGVAAQCSWEALVMQRIFRPLAMQRSRFSLPSESSVADSAVPYMLTGTEVREMAYRPLTHSGPAGSIYSTVTDLAPWLVLHLANGQDSNALISRTCLRELHTPQMVTPAPAFRGRRAGRRGAAGGGNDPGGAYSGTDLVDLGS